MIWKVEIREKPGVFDAWGEGIAKDIHDLGLTSVSGVSVVSIFRIEGPLNEEQIRRISEELLVDRITQEYQYFAEPASSSASDHGQAEVIEIAYHPGVMDPVEASTLKGIRDLGIEGVRSVRTAKKYILRGQIPQPDLNLIVDKVLSNKLIQHVVRRDVNEMPRAEGSRDNAANRGPVTVAILKASEATLKKISRDRQLFLNVGEMKAIREFFRKQDREPTDCELETIAQTWSEHCHHKTFRGDIRLQTKDKGRSQTVLVRNLLKSTIMKATEKVNKPWCVSVFHDNAGVIEFDDEMHVCFKVETHNHPSALEPFGGANTGIGGVIRDTLGTGLGAKPIASTDVFCFAPPDYPFAKLPAGTLHPRRIMKGVVSGVRDYGNKMGIPTVNGAILFDEQFVGNPLVYCGSVGVLPKGREHKKVSSGDMIVVAGGRTGRDGIHGATFSSGELTSESEVLSSGAVQIGDPIQEKKVLDVLLQARDQGLYAAITDCGAGGLSSAVGEMGAETGAKVDLDKVPLKYQGLSYMEIWISESQERMVMAVPPKNVPQLLSLFAAENVEATVIGQFTDTGRLRLSFHGQTVCDLDMSFLHRGIPRATKTAVWARPKIRQPRIPEPESLTEPLLDVLSHYNVCSKEWVIRQYDHEVQGGSVIKPLSGVAGDGPSDAAVIRPNLGSFNGIAIANGINVRFGKIDPFEMAVSCVDEAIRQIIAVGGDLERIALLDNFCWGNPDKPDRLGGLVRCAQGCYHAAVGFGVPFISGKDSLYNEYTLGRRSLAIPGTLLISSIGIIEDVRRCVTMDLKEEGNLLYVIGETAYELGGSIYFDTLGWLGPDVPRVNLKRGRRIFAGLTQAVRRGLVRSLHDCSEGGLGTALAEMAFSGGKGVTARLDAVPWRGLRRRDDAVLFSESNTRFLAEVSPAERNQFEKILSGLPMAVIGRVEGSPEFVVYGLDRQVRVNVSLRDLKEAWQKPLRW